MHDWLAHRARTTPDREALVNASSGNAWTYATLDETVEEMAGRLAALDVDEGDHLAAALATGVEEVCLIHAAMRVGAVLVPLPPEFTPPELAERFDHADVDAVVCDETTESQVRGAAEQVEPWLDVFTIDDTDWADATPLSAAEPVEFDPADWGRADTQLLLFTSGTTGTPKAVRLTMGNLLASATASAFRLGIDPKDSWLVPLSLHHMGGIAPVLRSTLYGTTAIVRESFDPGGTVDDIREHEATCVSLVPTMLRRMLSARGTLPDSLRFALVGGAPCPAELIERCRDYSVPVCPTYGMTETASQVATARHTEAYDNPESVGRPLLGTTVTVVDSTGAPVEPGETGELVVNGPTVSPGYYDDPATTGEAMGSYGFHTGDVGRFDEDGRLYVLNRLDDRILSGGENVDPGEVVDALREHPAVEDAAVVGLDDETWGERVAALLVPVEGAEIDAAEIEPFLRDRLAGFKLPRTVGVADELPRTVSGTVEREAVRERLTDGDTHSIGREEPNARAAADEERVRAIARETDEPEGGDGNDDAETSERSGSLLDADSENGPTPDRVPGMAEANAESSEAARSLLGAEEGAEDEAGDGDETGNGDAAGEGDDTADGEETDEEREGTDERRGGAALSRREVSRVLAELDSDRLTGIGDEPTEDAAADDAAATDDEE